MSDLQITAIKNWLQATADDAMGMEPGDRAMANEALKRIAELEGENIRLTAIETAARLSQNYGPDSTDMEWDDFWRGLEKALKKGDTGKRPDFTSLPKVCAECGHQYEPWDEHCTKCADTKEGDT